ncbi:hypothetical protein AKO1_001884 [Acrasis kona]|uniref:Uncharacterized protein n=1 Tax=Acrasis kona TaxID=1008807 RepID=A0AAW2Z8N8_9EUKA
MDLDCIKGMCYQPTPHDFCPGHSAYFDSDYYNDDFEQLWGSSGRGDLKRMKEELDVNFIHIYNWCTLRNHENFLKECAALSIKVPIPISNYTLGLVREGQTQTAEHNVRDIVQQAIHFAPVVVPMWVIGNEFELEGFNINHIVQVVELVDRYDTKNLNFAIPVSFKDQALPTLRQIKNAFQTQLPHLLHRLVFCINIFNSGSDIESFFRETYAQEFSDVPVFIGEYGKDSLHITELQQSEWIHEQFQTVFKLMHDPSLRFFKGGCLFEWNEEHWKPQPHESTFGLFRMIDDGITARTLRCGHNYPIDELKCKPAYEAIRYHVDQLRRRPLNECSVPPEQQSSIAPSAPPLTAIDVCLPVAVDLPAPTQDIIYPRPLPPKPQINTPPVVQQRVTLPPPPVIRQTVQVPLPARTLPPPPTLPRTQVEARKLPPPPIIKK